MSVPLPVVVRTSDEKVFVIVLGSNFDIYHRQPTHQRNMLAGLKGSHRSEIQVGGRTFSLVASPIVGELGERLGTVVEWLDRTAEVAIEEEVSGIIRAAASAWRHCLPFPD